MSSYRVTATHDGQAWIVRIEDEAASPVGEIRAAALEEVDAGARALVTGQVDERPEEVELHIEVQLDPGLQARLDRIEDLRRETDREVNAVEDGLVEAGVSTRDVVGLLADTISNAQIAAHGLRRHPQAIAVRFDDHGRFATTTCRACLEEARSDYAALPPGGRNTLIVRGPLMCDVCFDDIPSVR